MRERLLVNFYIDVDYDSDTKISQVKKEIKDQIKRGVIGSWGSFTWDGFKDIKVKSQPIK